MQEGIFYQKGATPGKHWGILFLRAKSSSSSSQIYDVLKRIWLTLINLKSGRIDDLPGIILPVPTTGLQVTIGYGKNIFSRTGIRKPLPLIMQQFNFRSPAAAGGGKLLLASGLSYADSVIKNPGTEDIAFQFISDSELLVYRCFMVINKIVSKLPNDDSFPLEIVKFYTGFQREDHRSWIEFHDGISNLKSGKERLDAIMIKDITTVEDQWMMGGTFLTFLRIEVNIDLWNQLDRITQEILVGRNKISGCALQSVMDDHPITVSGCPFSGTSTIIDKNPEGEYINQEYFETPIAVDKRILDSHVQRANHHREPVSHRDSLRIFRQGYEFFETSDAIAKVKVGLNFVSFQDTPERLIRILTQETWLGNINFGGVDVNQNRDTNFLMIWAAGIYIIPPANNIDKIPGYELFE